MNAHQAEGEHAEHLADVPRVRHRVAAPGEQQLHSGGPSTARNTAAGTTMTEASLTPLEKSSRTSEYRRSVACPLIRGSSALITEIPTIAYGSWKSCQA